MNNINVLIFLLGLSLASEADASRNFNLTGWFDTGFSIGHGRQERRHRVRESEKSVAEVKRFKIHDVFTQAKFIHQTDDESEDNNEVAHQHGGRHHADHRH